MADLTLSRGFVHTLIGDVVSAFERVETTADSLVASTHRRDAIRATFAAIEGVVWVYREHLRDAAARMDRLTVLQDFALQERSYNVGERGDLSEQIRYISLPAMIRLVTNIAQNCCPSLVVDFDHIGWVNLKSAIKVRNRLTHPKSLADLEITMDELGEAQSGFYWLLALAIEGMAALNDEMVRYRSEALDLVSRLKDGDEQAIEEYQRVLKEID